MFLRPFGSKQHNVERKTCAEEINTDKLSGFCAFLSLIGNRLCAWDS